MDPQTTEKVSSDDDSDIEMEEQNAEELKAARERLALNDLDYDAHLHLIKLLRKSGELESLREAREHFSLVYPLASDLWMEWLTDEKSICTSQEDRISVKKIFDRSVVDYMSVNIWLEYIMFMLGGGDFEATREVTERALSSVGTHVAEGVLVWQAVVSVEKTIFSAIDKDDTKKQEEQMKRIQSLYKRQARVPLMGVDKSQFLAEAEVMFEEKEMQALRKDLEQSIKKCKEKIPYEEALVRASSETEKLEAYRNYLDHVRKADNPTVIQNLYERCVAELCLNAGIWEEYVRFAISLSSLAILSICERSQRNCPWSATLCDLRLRSITKFSTSEAETRRTELRKCLDLSLRVGLPTNEDLLKVWMSYLVMLRQDISNTAENTPGNHAFRIACKEASLSVSQLINDSENECVIERFQAKIEARCFQNNDRARQLFNESIFKKGNNFKKAEIWLEFINLQRSCGCDAYARKLFQRALERVWDQVEWIGSQFKMFEEECGNLESLEDFEKRYISRILLVQKKRQEDADKAGDRAPKKGKSLLSQKETVNEFPDKSSKRKIKHDQTDQPPKRQKTKEEAHPSPKKPKTVDQSGHGVHIRHDPKNDYRTVFLSNLDYNAGEKEILPIFADCGKVEELRLTKDFQGRSKGFGYLMFEDSSGIFKALKKDRTPVGMRPMYVSKCDPEKTGHAFKYSTAEEKDKLFVRGLPFSLKEGELRKIFSEIVPIKSLRLVVYRNGLSKGCCYIDYNSAEDAEKVRVAMDGKVILDKTISVLISDPTRKEKKPAPMLINPSKKLSLMPRSLTRKGQPPIPKTEAVTDKPLTNSKSNEQFRKMFIK